MGSGGSGSGGAGGLSGFGGGGGGGAGGAGGGGGGGASPNTASNANSAGPPDPVSNGGDTISQQSMIVLYDGPQPDVFGGSGPKLPGTPPGPETPPGLGTPPGSGTPRGPQSNLIPDDCIADCGDLSPHTTLLDCTENCGGDPPSGTGVQLAAVPEPGMLALLGVGLASLGGLQRRKSA